MGEAKRRKLLDSEYGKTKKMQPSQIEFIQKNTAIASCLQYFVEALSKSSEDEKHYQDSVLKALRARAKVMKKQGGANLSIKEVLSSYGHEHECSAAFLSLGLSAICDGIFAYIKGRGRNIKSMEEIIKSFDHSDVEKLATNNEKYVDEQERWLDAFSNM